MLAMCCSVLHPAYYSHLRGLTWLIIYPIKKSHVTSRRVLICLFILLHLFLFFYFYLSILHAPLCTVLYALCSI